MISIVYGSVLTVWLSAGELIKSCENVLYVNVSLNVTVLGVGTLFTRSLYFKSNILSGISRAGEFPEPPPVLLIVIIRFAASYVTLKSLISTPELPLWKSLVNELFTYSTPSGNWILYTKSSVLNEAPKLPLFFNDVVTENSLLFVAVGSIVRLST